MRTKACPNRCGGRLERVEGEIGEHFPKALGKYLLRDETVIVVRPATFWACSQCEHCEEILKGATR